MKKIVLGLAASLLLLVSCSTTAPIMADVAFPHDSSKYVILGRVTAEMKTNKSGYVVLLEKAKEQFPNCDDVVNIVVDAKIRYGLFGGVRATSYVMSGVAIDYVEVK